MLVAGVDEAGRGPLAGIVVASAVILNTQCAMAGLMDSKQLSAPRRKALALKIREEAIAFAVSEASVEEIDQYNILQATLLAMKRAILALPIQPDYVLIDGQQSPAISIPCKAIIKGDQLHPEISAASILAKVFRDDSMLLLHQQYPEYGFAQHKGYGTQQHLKALDQHGYTPAHRYSFQPVKQSKPSKYIKF